VLPSIALVRTLPLFSATLRFDAYTKVDLFVGHQRLLMDRIVMTLFGGANNLLNESYFENGFRAPRAVWRGGIKFRF
jgi:hypothetical protein